MKKYLIILCLYFSCLQADPVCLTQYLSPKSFFASEEAEAVLLTQNLKSPAKELARTFATALKIYEKSLGSDFSFKDVLAVSYTSAESFVFVTSEKVFKFPELGGFSRKWPKFIDFHQKLLESDILEHIVPFKITQNVDLSKINLMDPSINPEVFADPVENLDIYKETAPVIIQDFSNNELEDYIKAHPEKSETIHKALITLQNSLLKKGYYIWDHNKGNLVYEETPEGIKILVRDIGALRKIEEKTKAVKIANEGVLIFLSYWNIENHDLLKDQPQMLSYLDKLIESLQKDDPYDSLKSPILQAA